MNKLNIIAIIGIPIAFGAAAAYPDNYVDSNANTKNRIRLEPGITIQKVTFPNRNITVLGNLHLPKDFDKNKKYPAVLIGHPPGGVKEQTAGLYAQKLAEHVYIALAFDASYQGESGGEPRYLEDPAVRVEDFRAATDYLAHTLLLTKTG